MTDTRSEDSIRVVVRQSGEFSETLPFLVPAPGGVTLETPRGNFKVSFDPAATAAISDQAISIRKKHVVVLTLRARDELSYTLEPDK